MGLIHIHETNSCDRGELSKCVTDGMLASLNSQMKEMQKIGKYEWDSVDAGVRPRVVHIAAVNVSTGKTTECKMAQITVRVYLKQRMRIFKDEKVIGGSPDHVPIKEYIVLEKWLDGEWAKNDWKIAGKVHAP